MTATPSEPITCTPGGLHRQGSGDSFDESLTVEVGAFAISPSDAPSPISSMLFTRKKGRIDGDLCDESPSMRRYPPSVAAVARQRVVGGFDDRNGKSPLGQHASRATTFTVNLSGGTSSDPASTPSDSSQAPAALAPSFSSKLSMSPSRHDDAQ